MKSHTDNSDQNDSDQNDSDQDNSDHDNSDQELNTGANTDQELNTGANTDFDSDNSESVLQIKKPISDLISLLSSVPFSPLRPRLLELPHSTQVQLDCQNRMIAKANAKHEELQLHKKKAMNRRDRRNLQRCQKPKDLYAYLA